MGVLRRIPHDAQPYVTPSGTLDVSDDGDPDLVEIQFANVDDLLYWIGSLVHQVRDRLDDPARLERALEGWPQYSSVAKFYKYFMEPNVEMPANNRPHRTT